MDVYGKRPYTAVALWQLKVDGARHNWAFDCDGVEDPVYGHGQRRFVDPHHQKAFIDATDTHKQHSQAVRIFGRACVAMCFSMVAMVIAALVAVLVLTLVLDDPVTYPDVIVVGPSTSNGEVTLTEHTWNADLSIASSEGYRELENQFITEMNDLYLKSELASVYSNTTVRRFRQGSVIVAFTVHLTGATPSVRLLPVTDNLNEMETQAQEATSADVTNVINSGIIDGVLGDLPAGNALIESVTIQIEIQPGNSENSLPDTESPVVVCPAEILTDTDEGEATALIDWDPPDATDDSGNVASIMSDPPPGSSFPIGETEVVVVAYDEAQNVGTCTFTVTVSDNEQPNITCPNDITETLVSGPYKVITWKEPAASDNSGLPVQVTSSFPSGTSFAVGKTQVVVTATDEHDNSAQCRFAVNILDEEDPLLTCPLDIIQHTDIGQSTATVTWSPATGTDNSNRVTTPTADQQPGEFEIGVHSVTYTAQDISGNTGECSFTVTVVDEEAPVLACPLDITKHTDIGQSTAMVTWSSATGTDNSNGITTPTTDRHPGKYEIGVHSVRYTTQDLSGNTGECSFTVTVVDDEAPVLACPSNITQHTDIGQSMATVTWSPATGTDNSNSITSPTADRQPGRFEIGVYSVRYTAQDLSGNTGECSFTVTVVDEESPVIICPASLELSTNLGQPSASVNWSAPVVTDNYNSTLTPISDLQPGDYPVGVYVVTYVVNDHAGNNAKCNFTVIVVADIVQETNTDSDFAAVTWPEPSVTDNVGQDLTAATNSTPGNYGVGVTVVRYTATDQTGNVGSCSFNITVFEPVTITCPDSITKEADPLQPIVHVTWTPATTDVEVKSLNSDLQPGDYEIGQHLVTYTATYVGGIVQCSFTVSVENVCGLNPLFFSNAGYMENEPAAPGSWPWQVFLPFRSTSCGAVLISDQWALTPAHCVNDPGIKQSLKEGILGEVNLLNSSSTRVTSEIENVLIHPGFQYYYYDHDIALIKLSEPVTYSNYIRPVCLSTDSTIDDSGNDTKCYVSEWGYRYSDQHGVVASELLQTNVPLVDAVTCDSNLKAQGSFSLTDNMICTYLDPDFCQTQISGPLVCQEPDGRWALVGIGSLAIGCGQTDLPAVFTRVSKYVEYIQSVVDENPSISCEPVNDACLSHVPYTDTFMTSQDVVTSYKDLHVDYFYSETCGVDDADSIKCGLFFKGCDTSLIPCRNYCKECFESDLVCGHLPQGPPGEKWCVEGQDYCGEQNISLSAGDPYLLRNPFFPVDQTGRRDCVWLLTAPPGFNILLKIDVLFINEYLHTLSFGRGTNPDNMLSVIAKRYDHTEFVLVDKSEAWVRFGTTLGSSYRGFSMRIYVTDEQDGASPCSQDSVVCSGICLPIDWICDGVKDCLLGEDESNCNGTVSQGTIFLAADDPYFIVSPGIHDSYPPYMNTTWVIACPLSYVIRVTIIFASTDECCDILSVKTEDGEQLLRWSGHETEESPTVTSDGTVLVINFVSDDIIEFQGFIVKVERLNSTRNDLYDCGGAFSCLGGVCLPHSAVCNTVGNCLHDIDEECTDDIFINSSYYFTSPNFPSSYPDNLAYTWSFTTHHGYRILLTFLTIITERQYDFIEVGETNSKSRSVSLLRWSGGPPSGLLRILSSHENLWLVFTSDVAFSKQGFEATVEMINVTYAALDCGSDFKCMNGVCLPPENVCDNEMDCGNNRDESNCTAGCDFLCSDSQCINHYQVCDGISDCSAREDESYCIDDCAFTCPQSLHGCLLREWMCDGFVDCSEGEDESFNTCGGDITLEPFGQLFLTSPNFPNDYPDNINITWNITTEVGAQLLLETVSFDTEYGSDYITIQQEGEGSSSELVRKWSGKDASLTVLTTERTMQIHFYTNDRVKKKGFEFRISSYMNVSTVCQSNLFNCGNGACFRMEVACDSEINCGNGADSEPCPVFPSCSDVPDECVGPLPYSESIQNRNESITSWHQGADCHPMFSSLYCWLLYPECPPDSRLVHSLCLEACLEITTECRETIENVTGTPMLGLCDDLPAGNTTNGFCKEEFEGPCFTQEFDCADGSGLCLFRFQRCNGIVDCPSASDEDNCTAPCNNFYQFECPDGSCISRDLVCDGFSQCPHDADEIECSGSGCGMNEFSCGEFCINNEQVCDGQIHCFSAEDESICDKVLYVQEDNIRNFTSPGYPSEYPENTNATWYFRTDTGVQILVYFASFDTELNYDVVDIGDGLQALHHQLLNWSGSDGTITALSASNHLWVRFTSDGILEYSGFLGYAYAVRVPVNDSLECEVNQYSCSGAVCIPSYAVCDGAVSCGNGENEAICSGCLGDGYECFDGECIRAISVCDGISDCFSSEDEQCCDIPTDSHCSPVPPECQLYLPYNSTRFPNQFASNMTEAENTFQMLLSFADCHENAAAIICSSLYPDCLEIGTVFEACNATCYDVARKCHGVYFNETGELWPVTCSHYGLQVEHESVFCLAVKYRVTIPVVVSMNGTFTDDLQDPDSSAYQQLEYSFIAETNALFEDNCHLRNQFVSTELLGFSPGSINISFQVILNQLRDSDPSLIAYLVCAVLEDAIDYQTHYHDIPLIPQSISVSQAMIVDNVPPTVVSCPQNIEATASGNESVYISWAEPEFVDNSGAWTYQESPLFPFDYFQINTLNEVLYVVADPSGNQAVCQFTIEIIPYICEPVIEDLVEGQTLTITTPLYPSTFPEGIRCVFNVSTLPGFNILTTFNMFQLGSAELTTEIGIFSGFDVPIPLISSSSTLHMVFVSKEGEFTHQGFHASLQVVNASDYSGLLCENRGQVLTNVGLICDGTADCIDGSDEHDCACHVGDYVCYNSDKCLQMHQFCDGIRQCPQREDEINCHVNCSAGNFSLSTDQPLSIKNTNSSWAYSSNMECAWLLVAPENHGIVIHNEMFDLQDGDFVLIGEGLDWLNTTNVVRQLIWKDPEDVVIDSNVAWIRFYSRSEGSSGQGFSFQVVALQQEDFARETFQCYSGRRILQSLVCNGINDCEDFADEDKCPPCVGINHTICQSLLPYSQTIFPHEVALSQGEAIRLMINASSVSDCHTSFLSLMCSVLFPDCPHNGPVQRPCKSVCLDVAISCKAVYEESVGKAWPIVCENLDDKLPDGNGFCNGSIDDMFNTEICGTRPNSPPQSRIVGGIGASLGDWPWIASLRDSYGDHQCGATLITERWAVTAAHCIGFVSTAVFGDLLLSTGTPYHHETTFTAHTHRQYNDYTKIHDIALLELHKPVNYSGYVRPACVSTYSYETEQYSRCYIAGWGHLYSGATDVPDRLQEALIEIFTANECLDYLGNDFFEEFMLCAGYDQGGIDACQGDSGGPLVCEGSDGRWHLVGVTSFGFGCALPGYPGAYTRIYTHISFINSVISQSP